MAKDAHLSTSETDASKEKSAASEVPAEKNEVPAGKKQLEELFAELSTIRSQLTTVTAERDELKEACSALNQTVSINDEEFEKFDEMLVAKTAEIADLHAKLAASISKPDGSSYVVLDGVLHKITHRDSMKGLYEQFRKRFVDENAITIVCEKIGG